MKHRIVVVGAGFSGLLTSLQLLRQGTARDIHITLVESSGKFGTGLAYGVCGEAFRLNVPAGAMGAWPEDPEHFLKWLNQQNFPAKGTDFVPRELYGRYLQAQLAAQLEEVDSARFTLIENRVVDISFNHDGGSVYLENGDVLSAHTVVLAIGNLPRTRFQGQQISGIFALPYDPRSYEAIENFEDILIVGAGLSAVDAVLECESRGFKGTYTLVSRHGILPTTHSSIAALKRSSTDPFPKGSLRKLLGVVRQEIAECGSAQPVVDALRWEAQGIWASLSLKEKRRFLRHLRPRWESHRHRIPIESSRVIEKLKADDRLSVIPAKVENLIKTNVGVRLTYSVNYRRTPKMGPGPEPQPNCLNDCSTTVRDFNRAFFCTGAEGDLQSSDDGLVKNLVRSGLLSAGPLGLGAAGNYFEFDGASTRTRLYVVGPLLREELWEITAVPDLRIVIAKTAAAILTTF